MIKTIHHYDFLLLNVPLLRPGWPVPTFSRILPMLKSEGFSGDWWDENVKFFRFYYSEEKLLRAYQVVEEQLSYASDSYIEKQLQKVLEKPIDLILKSLRQMSNKEIFNDLGKYNEVFYNVFHDASQILSHAYARELVVDIEQFSRENFPVYSLVYEPCEVAYYAPLNNINGMANIIETSQNIRKGGSGDDK